MEINDLSTEVSRLGECRIPSPMSRVQFVSDDEHVLCHSNLMEIEAIQAAGEKGAAMILRLPGRGIYRRKRKPRGRLKRTATGIGE